MRAKTGIAAEAAATRTEMMWWPLHIFAPVVGDDDRYSAMKEKKSSGDKGSPNDPKCSVVINISLDYIFMLILLNGKYSHIYYRPP